ncbi:hypothetical protein IG631_07234 [Alternaria alternata]|nr:hypothetical protein IG631_07234 [Alternaria alternata]
MGNCLEAAAGKVHYLGAQAFGDEKSYQIDKMIRLALMDSIVVPLVMLWLQHHAISVHTCGHDLGLSLPP